ncbi:MAG: tetratricopeptide repeat protein [Myxococcales bacterium]
MKQLVLASLVLALSGASVGCSKKISVGGGGSEPGAPAAGGEAPAGTPGAPGQAQSGSATEPGKPTTSSPAGTSTAASPWGSAEADTGRPLPPRKALEGGARSNYEQGVKAAHAGDTAGAKSAFEAAVKADGNAYQALYALGVMSDREGKESQAIDYYRRSLRAQADYEEAAQGIVAIYLRQGQPDKAVAFMQPLADQWERNLLLQAYYADLLVQVGRVDDAILVARKALRRDERHVPSMLSLIRANLRAGRVELADSILDQALAVDDKNAELHYYRGIRYLDDKRLGEALPEFKKAVDLDPDFAEARMELGILLLAGANYSEALTQFQAVEKISPKLVEVQLALGDAYRSTKQWDKAKAAFDKALRMKSDLPQAHYDLALMYMAAGAEFPGLDLLTALGKAKEEFGTYRSMMGSRLARDDASTGYLDDIDKAVAREQKRIEREKKAAERDAAKKAESAAPAAPAAPAGGSK